MSGVRAEPCDSRKGQRAVVLPSSLWVERCFRQGGGCFRVESRGERAKWIWTAQVGDFNL